MSTPLGVTPPTAADPEYCIILPTANPCPVCETVIVALPLVTIKGLVPNEPLWSFTFLLAAYGTPDNIQRPITWPTPAIVPYVES